MNPKDGIIPDSHQASLPWLEQVGLHHASATETLTSSVTTAWGVDWDEEMIARDLMQNFFDANRDCLDRVIVRSERTSVEVIAPTEYDLKRLFFIGSEKDPAFGDVGQYGEGFKAAATCFLRQGHNAIVAASRSRVLCIRIGEQSVAGTDLYPLVYDFFAVDTLLPGNRLWLLGASKKLGMAMQTALSHFFHERNPLIGSQICCYGSDFQVYRSTTPHGHMFYRNLKRGEIPDLPLVLVLNKPYANIEKKIAQDRDRKAFGEELRDAFYKVWASKYFNGHTQRIHPVLEASQHLWDAGKGHPLLAAIAASNWRDDHREKLFGDQFFARSNDSDTAEQLQLRSMETEWLRQGRIALPAYFSKLGALSARRHLNDLKAKAQAEAVGRYQRSPTPAEWDGLNLMDRVLMELAKPIRDQFHNRTQYSVADTEEILGQLKASRSYGTRSVFFSAQVFVSPFSRALAVYLHEHAHIFGHDGSRGFTDALTELLEVTVKFRKAFDAYEAQWDGVREQVRAERRLDCAASSDAGARLQKLDMAALRSLLLRLPPALIEDLLP